MWHAAKDHSKINDGEVKELYFLSRRISMRNIILIIVMLMLCIALILAVIANIKHEYEHEHSYSGNSEKYITHTSKHDGLACCPCGGCHHFKHEEEDEHDLFCQHEPRKIHFLIRLVTCFSIFAILLSVII